MTAHVMLTATEGSLQGKQFCFNDRTRFTVGRSSDCVLHMPDEERNRVISRHHCAFDIDPPTVRVWDFGSRNGTYVNGVNIGQRLEFPALDEAPMRWLAYELLDGDKVQVGTTVFQVNIFVPAECAHGLRAIPEEQMDDAEWLPGPFLCDACRQKELELAECPEEGMLVG
jgi:eukaryotic-like serine/threonine-protein kinase